MLSLSPLGRLGKAQNLLLDLARLCHLSTQLQQGGGGGGGNSNGAAQQQGEQHLLAGWLDAACAQFQLAQAEREGIVAGWTPAAFEALAASSQQQQHQEAGAGGQEGGEVASLRRLKKLLRGFAELHSRTQ